MGQSASSIDVLDPAFAPGTGTPEPGGMTRLELLAACRTVAERIRLVGADVVEVAPTALVDRTALVAERIVREVLTGVALARAANGAAPRAPRRG
jgi:arginase family enzyme